MHSLSWQSCGGICFFSDFCAEEELNRETWGALGCAGILCTLPKISDDSESKTNIHVVIIVLDSKSFDPLTLVVMMSDIAGSRKRQTVAVAL